VGFKERQRILAEVIADRSEREAITALPIMMYSDNFLKRKDQERHLAESPKCRYRSALSIEVFPASNQS